MTNMPLMANLELNIHGGTHTMHGSDAQKKTEASFVRRDYATEAKEMQKQTKSFRLLKSSKIQVAVNMFYQQTCQLV